MLFRDTKPLPVPNANVTLIFGNHRLDTIESQEQRRQVAAIRLHPDLARPFAIVNDVSVIKLSSPIHFNDAIRPICLPQQGAPIPSGQLCVAAGWGRNDSKNSFPRHVRRWYPKICVLGKNQEDGPVALQQVTLPVHPVPVCVNSWGNTYNEQQMICAGSLEGGSGICQVWLTF